MFDTIIENIILGKKKKSLAILHLIIITYPFLFLDGTFFADTFAILFPFYSMHLGCVHYVCVYAYAGDFLDNVVVTLMQTEYFS